MKKARYWCAFFMNSCARRRRMTPGSDHIASHRLYPAATNQLELSPPETQHLQHCAFCHGIFQFFHSSRKKVSRSDPPDLLQSQEPGS
jgi:hypothetical protein